MALRLHSEGSPIAGNSTQADVQRANTATTLEKAALRRLRLSQQRGSSRVASAVKRAGVRTSGVGQIALGESRRTNELSRTNLLTQLAGQRLGQINTTENIKLQNKFAKDRLLERLRQERATARAGQDAATRNALIGGGVGLIGALA